MKTVGFMILPLAVMVAVAVSAGVPQKISFQGYVSTLSHVPVEGEHTLSFGIYDSKIDGSLLWTDTDTLQVTDGQFSTYLGEHTPLPATIFTGQVLWLSTALDGGLLPERQPLVSVAYSFRSEKADSAYHAEKADTADVALHAGAGGDSCLWESNGPDVYRDTGNVGIGKATPQYPLHIERNLDSPLTLVYGRNLSSGTHAMAAIGVGDDADVGFAIGRLGSAATAYPGYGGPGESFLYASAGGKAFNVIVPDAANGKLRFFVGNNATGNPRMVIEKSGKVGLGLASPAALLHLSGANPDIILNEGADNAARIVHQGSYDTGFLQLQSFSTGWASPGIVVKGTAGNVGIGTTSPGEKLEVSGNLLGNGYWGRSDGQYLDLRPDGGSWGLVVRRAGATEDYVNLEAGSTYGTLGFVSSSGPLYFTSDRVGIGTSSPSASLEVAGSITVQGDLCVTGQKNAVVSTSQGMTKVYSEESAEIWFTDYGRGRLVNGRCHIDLPPLFMEMVMISAEHPMMVFLQEEGECNGLIVQPGLTGFDVVEKGDGHSSAAFSCRVVAKRKGYENSRLETAGAPEMGGAR